MKKFVAAILVFVLVLCCFTGCSSGDESDSSAVQAESSVASAEESEADSVEESVDEAEGNVIELGKSGLTVTTEKEYKEGEITTEDTDENQVAYYLSDETKVDFDVYEWAKAADETLEAAAKEEAEEFEAEVEMKEINGFSVAVYNAKEESEGQEYDTATYMIDNGDYFVELVFWLDGENAAAEVEAIVATLAKNASEISVNEGEIVLGVSGLKINPEKEYKEGEITTEDTDENQVAYYLSDETKVDFDVYEWAKASDETLEAAAKEEAEEFEAEVEMKEINGFSVAVYNAKEESEGQEYDTATYMIDNGDYFVELVFWLDGENAAAEVEAIVATLTK